MLTSTTPAQDPRHPERFAVIERLVADLLGPQSAEELIERDRPSDRYLTGILYPPRLPVPPEEDESLDANGGDDDETNGTERESPVLSNMRRPASAGLSFAAEATKNQAAAVRIQVRCGTYRPVEPLEEAPASNTGTPSASERVQRRKKPSWQRTDHDVDIPELRLRDTPITIGLDDFGLPGLQLYIQTAPWGNNAKLVTAALVNVHEVEEGDGKEVVEERSFFQLELTVRPGEGTRLLARPSRRAAADDDGRSNALLYRDAVEYAVGHTCSAQWKALDGSSAEWVRTCWLPNSLVPATSRSGSKEFRSLDPVEGRDSLSAAWLAEADTASLYAALKLLPLAYERWIASQRQRLSGLPSDQLRQQAELQLAQCEQVRRRIIAGAELIKNDAAVRDAFRLANKAMVVQRRWTRGDTDLRWWPFQLGFILLALPSLTDPASQERETMDLLWFPTGGGKTEAYLALVAIALFHRRYRYPGKPDSGVGVAAIMRYTLRLLTTQQFQRATALVLACEYLRRGRELPAGMTPQLGETPFSVGLWVGDDAVANRFEDAAAALLGGEGGYKTPAQIERCPACRKRLRWSAQSALRQTHVSCTNAECELARTGSQLPVWTVDDDVYRVAPSLLIGTVDKFAQIVRKLQSGALFGSTNENDSPDLIIQDELHLISGPLGSMTGLYETAIDILCSRDGRRPKVIGSTATIRRAEQQVRYLFNRATCQFPPPGIDASNSGFAVPDEEAPGRLYVGVTTAGRSAKFSLQATTASLLQSASALGASDEERDAYWTLVAYFNSLRELGGALVLMHDDVPASIRDYAHRRSEEPRAIRSVEELTSRVSQVEVRDKLSELERPWSSGEAIDVLLASNMISVGVDIPRLGLMVVNGQPKGIAEYIQATSRVGRGDIAGVVVTVYNNGKARDRSHYESFATWHSMLYRDVEATSVTPFASRARDRALHAVLVALLRHSVEAMGKSPVMTDEGAARALEFSAAIRQRAAAIDESELPDLDRQLREIIQEWRDRPALRSYWDDRRRNTSLLMSAEKAAALRAAGRPQGLAWPTPNSMRNVEPGTLFGLVEGLAVEQAAGDDAE